MSYRGHRLRARDPRTGRLYRMLEPIGAPPPALRRAKLDNIAIIPGSALPFRDHWQSVANSLPPGQVLVVLPESHSPARRALERLADRLRARGTLVTLVLGRRVAGRHVGTERSAG
jgi:hypothetical protein